ncbi:unnamed protein product [Cladocopium goreaui]|uniref:Uncharacterized protein n=1 Tax=Cladocopium goreaui TaxID=2562237 RepID=A0A9P1FTL5_9DINO|nr:unnamed protein product [Cladocopium goreaui]
MELTFLPRPIAVPVSTFGGRRIGRAELPRSGAPFLDAKTIAARGLGSAGSAAAATLGTLWVAGVRRRRRCKTWRHATDEEDFDYGAGKDYWDKRYQARSIREPVGAWSGAVLKRAKGETFETCKRNKTTSWDSELVRYRYFKPSSQTNPDQQVSCTLGAP